MYRYIEIAYEDTRSGDLFDEVEKFVHARVCENPNDQATAGDCFMVAMSGTSYPTLDALTEAEWPDEDES